MSKIALAVGLVFLLSFRSGEESGQEIIKKMKAVYSEKCVSQLMQYTLSNPNLQDDIVKSGSVKSMGNKYFIEMENELLVSDSKTTWIVLKEEQEISMFCDSETYGTFLFYSMAGNWVELPSDSETRKFRMKDADNSIYTMFIDTREFVITKVEVLASSGTKFLYEYEDHVIEEKCHEKDFEVDLKDYEEYYVNDQREDDC
ncbi:MAG: hypothetical protein KDC92_08425 [Bacteroidetes bacterium]|nr:hypothetical protein [Bacteroidota bacterium]